jgi:hypothetical protein
VWDSRSAEVSGVTVRLHRPVAGEKHKAWRLVSAAIELDRLPARDERMRVQVPDEPRRQCELVAEHMVNIISVLEGSSKAVASPLLCVAFDPSGAIEREYLEQSSGIRAEQSASEHGVGSRIEWSPEVGRGLSDRMDGVALLSEAFSAGSEAATYRELVRFLELGFALPASDQRFKNSLVRYFASAPGYGYSGDEIGEWIGLRHPATHADLRKTKWVALGADVRHVVLRMRQACLDVLLNKEEWRSPSHKRRNVWAPDAITTSPRGEMIVKQGSSLSMLFRVLDEFGVYPRILGISVNHAKGSYAKYYQEPSQGPQSPGDAPAQSSASEASAPSKPPSAG